MPLPPKLRTYARLDLAAKEWVRVSGAHVKMHGHGWLCDSRFGTHGTDCCVILAHGWLAFGVRLRNTGDIIGTASSGYWVVLDLDAFTSYLSAGRLRSFVSLTKMDKSPTIEERSGAFRALADAYDCWQRNHGSPLRASRPPFLTKRALESLR